MEKLTINNIPINIRQNSRARRIIIKIRHGEVMLVVPRRASVKKALKFLESKEDWIRTRLAAQPDKIPLKTGAIYPILGTPHEVVYGGIRGKSKLIDNKITVYGDEKLAAQKIKKTVSEYLKAELTKIIEVKTAELGVACKKIAIRDNVTRWGSCSPTGTLSFTWRIVFAPRFVMEYLACHEVGHLREMNHGKKYWQLVEEIYPNYASAEQWLKKNGHSLHLYH